MGTPPSSYVKHEPCNPFFLCTEEQCAVTAACADDEFAHRIIDGPDERRLQLPFPHRAALTAVVLELGYTQTCAVNKDSVDAEGVLIAQMWLL